MIGTKNLCCSLIGINIFVFVLIGLVNKSDAYPSLTYNEFLQQRSEDGDDDDNEAVAADDDDQRNMILSDYVNSGNNHGNGNHGNWDDVISDNNHGNRYDYDENSEDGNYNTLRQWNDPDLSHIVYSMVKNDGTKSLNNHFMNTIATPSPYIDKFIKNSKNSLVARMVNNHPKYESKTEGMWLRKPQFNLHSNSYPSPHQYKSNRQQEDLLKEEMERLVKLLLVSRRRHSDPSTPQPQQLPDNPRTRQVLPPLTPRMKRFQEIKLNKRHCWNVADVCCLWNICPLPRASQTT